MRDNNVGVGIRLFEIPVEDIEVENEGIHEVIRAEIPDFRSQIDCVTIDVDYDGKVFDIDFSDSPPKKTDLVQSLYEFDTKKCGKQMAVKVVDMLGEEILTVIGL